MDSLLCDEVWLSSDGDHATDVYARLTKEECEEGVAICLNKEMSYMPQPGYAQFLVWTHSFGLARFKAVEWLVKCGSRLNLSPETVFNAVNYLDRYLSMNQCHELTYSTVQLLSVACLSIAAKFIDTSSPSLHEIQMEGMDQIFDSPTVERIELRVLNELGWRLSSTTAYSYVELLLTCHDHDKLSSKLTNLLFTVLLDPRLVEYRPCVVAASALKQELTPLLPVATCDLFAFMARLISEDLKEDMIKCDVIMEGLLIEPRYNIDTVGCGEHQCPWSPVTVLLTETRVDMIYDDCVDDDQIDIVSLPKTTAACACPEKEKKKRKREEQ